MIPSQAPVAARPGSSPESSRRGRVQIGFYFGLLGVTAGLGYADGLLRLPVQFWLKNQLQVGPEGLAVFEALAFAPAYLAFVFGFLRDHWRPSRSGDRGYLRGAGLVAIGCYVWLALEPAGYYRLLAGIVLSVAAYQMLFAASEALSTWVAQRNLMTGRLSALDEFGEAAVGALAALAGGWMAVHLSLRGTFLVAAGCSAAVVLHSFWRPRVIFEAREPTRPNESAASIRLLLGHRALRPILLMMLIWSFSPGWHTPLLFYLTEGVGISSEAFGVCRAMDFVGVSLASVLYFWLCRRVQLRSLLSWGILLNLFPGLLFLLVRNAPEAMATSLIVWLCVGFLNAALGDLLMRACPAGLEGSCRMLGITAAMAAATVGDLLGASLYTNGGLLPCIVIEIVCTLGMIPLLWLVPSVLIAARESDGRT